MGEEDYNDKAHTDLVFDKLRDFRGESMFKRAAMNILVKMQTEEEIAEMKR
jgi:hypothetical protein